MPHLPVLPIYNIYVSPILLCLDSSRIAHRLFKDTTTFREGHHRKDLNALNRPMNRLLIIDTDKESFALQAQDETNPPPPLTPPTYPPNPPPHSTRHKTRVI